MRSTLKVTSIMFALVALLVLQLGTATAQPAPPAQAGFSFAVYGDSRPMMYLPYKAEQEAEARQLLVDMFALVLPVQVAAEVVQKDVKLIYDPATKELVQIVMPFETKSEVTTLRVDQGWVTEASVEDVKLLPGVHQTMFRLHGGDWVARGVVQAIQSERAKFVLNTGDIVWWGKQGRTVTDSPYWKRVNQLVLQQSPAPDLATRAARLHRRSFPRLGNHEVWGDPKIEGVLNVVPYVKKLGVTPDRMIYTFDFNDVRFIFLWTGAYDYRAPTAWDANQPVYDEQVKALTQWL